MTCGGDCIDLADRYLFFLFQPGRIFLHASIFFSTSTVLLDIFFCNLKPLLDMYWFIFGVGRGVLQVTATRSSREDITITVLHNYQLPVVFDITTNGEVLKSVHKHSPHGLHSITR